jgi:hypothetical protein
MMTYDALVFYFYWKNDKIYSTELITMNNSIYYHPNQSILSCFQIVLAPSFVKTIIYNLSPVYMSLYAADLKAS